LLHIVYLVGDRIANEIADLGVDYLGVKAVIQFAVDFVLVLKLPVEDGKVICLVPVVQASILALFGAWSSIRSLIISLVTWPFKAISCLSMSCNSLTP
jgi:hypothetical protein